MRVLVIATILVGCAGARPAPPVIERPIESPRPVPLEAQEFELHAIDVGTGLSIFVTGPKVTFLYDAGSNDDIALGSGNRALAYLRHIRPNLERIEHIVLSHPHQDHVQLLPDILRSYAIGAVWDSGAVNEICGYRRFIEAVDELAIDYHSARHDAGNRRIAFDAQKCGADLPQQTFRVRHGKKIESGLEVPLSTRASMRFLHADGEDHKGKFNENSLVVALDLDGSRVLLMGDAEAGSRKDAITDAPKKNSIEAQLLACCTTALRADVMVVAHHGSRTSTRRALLDAVKPAIAVISSGPKKYGDVQLPDSVVVDELAKVAQVVRTDVDDDACKTNAAKLGPDADGRPGGCSNITITLKRGTPPRVRVWTAAD
jgi:competence protein ComEC